MARTLQVLPMLVAALPWRALAERADSDIEVRDGRAVLTGSVSRLDQSWTARELASRVRGIVTLENRLEVRSRPRDDASIRGRIRENLALDLRLRGRLRNRLPCCRRPPRARGSAARSTATRSGETEDTSSRAATARPANEVRDETAVSWLHGLR